MIQEACNNAVKHAQSSYLEVKVSYLEKKIVLVIKDDGKGFDVNAVPDETRDEMCIRDRPVPVMDWKLCKSMVR